MSRSLKKIEELCLLVAIDTTPRQIKSNDLVEFNCGLCNSNPGLKKWAEAKRSFKNNGFAYQCRTCLLNKYKNRGEEWLNNVRKAAQSSEHKTRAASNSITKIKKYFKEDILEVIRLSGVTYQGDLSSPGNTIKVTWPDGVNRTIRIRRFMKAGKIERPKIGKESTSHTRHKENLESAGLIVEMLGPNRAKLTYKNISWEQYWANHIDKKCQRKMKNIDTGLKIQEMLDGGTPLVRACRSLGVDPNRYYRNLRFGIGVVETAFATKNFEQLIKIDGATYNKQLSGSSYRPDVLIESAKLIIETDGMRYHSEEMKEKGYHATKWITFNDLGYKVLAFSEYEVREKRAIVDSMINHRLGKSASIGASSTKVRELSRPEADTFFERCHLRGKGRGITYGLVYKGDIVCALRFYEEGGNIHISRFACNLGTSVAGGYSRLLSRLPTGKNVINFVDRRHGSGEHLVRFGFVKSNIHIGFEWTDGYYHWNRRKFLGNSGYDHGLKKFWDYGQIKYIRFAES